MQQGGCRARSHGGCMGIQHPGLGNGGSMGPLCWQYRLVAVGQGWRTMRGNQVLTEDCRENTLQGLVGTFGRPLHLLAELSDLFEFDLPTAGPNPPLLFC